MSFDFKDKKSYHRKARQTWEATHGERPFGKKGKRFHVHHIDKDIMNNQIDNLICISEETHRVLHKGRFYTWRSDEILHVKDNTVPNYLDFENLDGLVDMLVQTMRDLGTELTEENGHREGWTDLIDYPEEAMECDVTYDMVSNKAYRFIWCVAYPLAVRKFIKKEAT